MLKVACTAGALLGGASEKDVKNMELFSESVGLAFQGRCFFVLYFSRGEKK